MELGRGSRALQGDIKSTMEETKQRDRHLRDREARQREFHPCEKRRGEVYESSEGERTPAGVLQENIPMVELRNVLALGYAARQHDELLHQTIHR